MRRSRILGLLGAFVALLMLASCSRPSAGEVFLTAPRNAYEYSLDIPDTLSYYDLAFYTRVDKFGREVLEPRKALRFDIVWRDPSDSTYRETVYIRPDHVDGTVQNYRTGMRFPLPGQWNMSVTVSPEVKGFRGLGLVWESYYGTR